MDLLHFHESIDSWMVRHLYFLFPLIPKLHAPHICYCSLRVDFFEFSLCVVALGALLDKDQNLMGKSMDHCNTSLTTYLLESSLKKYTTYISK
jgi:hypothetical protein